MFTLARIIARSQARQQQPIIVTSVNPSVSVVSPNQGVVQPTFSNVVLPASEPVRDHSNYAGTSSRVLGVIQICVGFAIVIANLVIFGLTTGYWSTFVAVSHYGCSVMILITGVLGMAAGKYRTLNPIIGFMVLSMIVCVWAFVGCIISVVHAGIAGEDHDPHVTQNVVDPWVTKRNDFLSESNQNNLNPWVTQKSHLLSDGNQNHVGSDSTPLQQHRNTVVAMMYILVCLYLVEMCASLWSTGICINIVCCGRRQSGGAIIRPAYPPPLPATTVITTATAPPQTNTRTTTTVSQVPPGEGCPSRDGSERRIRLAERYRGLVQSLRNADSDLSEVRLIMAEERQHRDPPPSYEK